MHHVSAIEKTIKKGFEKLISVVFLLRPVAKAPVIPQVLRTLTIQPPTTLEMVHDVGPQWALEELK